MNGSLSTEDIDMPYAPVMADRKRSFNERITKKTPINKAHVSRRPISPRGEPHPAARTKKPYAKTPRRMDIAPLPRSRLALKPLGLRFTKGKTN